MCEDTPTPSWAPDRNSNGRLLPRRCGYYHPGHELHWIPALRSANEPDTEETRGRLVGIDESLVVVEMRTGEVCRYYNHEPERLAEATKRDRQVVVRQRWWILHAGATLFSISTEQHWQPCPAQPLPYPTGPMDAETAMKLLQERGGVSIPTADLAFSPTDELLRRNDVSDRPLQQPVSRSEPASASVSRDPNTGTGCRWCGRDVP